MKKVSYLLIAIMLALPMLVAAETAKAPAKVTVAQEIAAETPEQTTKRVCGQCHDNKRIEMRKGLAKDRYTQIFLVKYSWGMRASMDDVKKMYTFFENYK